MMWFSVLLWAGSTLFGQTLLEHQASAIDDRSSSISDRPGGGDRNLSGFNFFKEGKRKIEYRGTCSCCWRKLAHDFRCRCFSRVLFLFSLTWQSGLSSKFARWKKCGWSFSSSPAEAWGRTLALNRDPFFLFLRDLLDTWPCCIEWQSRWSDEGAPPRARLPDLEYLGLDGQGGSGIKEFFFHSTLFFLFHYPQLHIARKLSCTHNLVFHSTHNRIKWLFERKDKESMSDAFLYENWEQVFQPFNDINETWNRWKLQFFQEIKSFIPQRTVTNFLKHRAAPWFTQDLKKLIRVKNRLFKKACSSGTDNHWETYRSARNKATKEIKKAKLDYVKRQANTLADLKCNLSRWWSIARDLCGFKSQRHSSASPLLDQSKNLLLDDKEKANLLNDVFINHNSSLALEAFPFGPSPLQETFDIDRISPKEVAETLRSLPNKSSCGSDEISYRLMKEAGLLSLVRL